MTAFTSPVCDDVLAVEGGACTTDVSPDSAPPGVTEQREGVSTTSSWLRYACLRTRRGVGQLFIGPFQAQRLALKPRVCGESVERSDTESNRESSPALGPRVSATTGSNRLLPMLLQHANAISAHLIVQEKASMNSSIMEDRMLMDVGSRRHR